MRQSLMVIFAAVVAVVLLSPSAARAADGTFDRTLHVSGPGMLSVHTGSGYIHVTPGTGNEIHIVGHVHASSWGMGASAEARVQQVVNHPPIEQSGNSVNIGEHMNWMNNVSIDYDITAPRGTKLDAESGSGDLELSDLGSSLQARTGSGTIHASGFAGEVALESGSGDIQADLESTNDVHARAGSGGIHLRGVNGPLFAETGSGDIDVGGKPASAWQLRSGSGSVTLHVGGAGFDLDASTGSGEVQSGPAISTHGSIGRHHVSGAVNGGGPTVQVATGSGDIRIH